MARSKRKLKGEVGVNMKKTKPKISGKERILKRTIQYTCGVCMKRVRGSSVLCTGCQKCCHKRCSGLENLNEAGKDFKCPSCVNCENGVRYPCGCCGKGVGANSALCTLCQKWCHKKCSGLKSLKEAGNKFRCPTCVRKGVKDQEVLEKREYLQVGAGELGEKLKCRHGAETDTQKKHVLVHEEIVQPFRKDAENMSDFFASVTKSKIIKKGKESCIGKVKADIPLIKKETYVEAVFDKQENTESLLLSSIGQININEDESMEVPLTTRVDDVGENYGSTGLNVTQTRDILSASPHILSHVDVNSTTQQFLLSHSCEKIVGDIEDKPRNTENEPQFQNLIAQAVHTEPVIIPSVLCNLKDQSQIKGDITASSSTSEDSHKQNVEKSDSKENPIDKKHIKTINDSIQDKMSKTDKKNEKLKVGENYARINYLVQASRKVFKNDKSVSSQLGSLAISFGRRLPQVRLDPLLKREMCKGCGVYLVYGVNAKVRHRSKRQKHLVVTCMICRTIKRFVTNPKHKLWSEQPEARVN